MSLWHSGHRSIKLSTELMSSGLAPSFPRDPSSLKATMCACWEKFPSFSVSGCSKRYSLHPANSQRPPERAAKRIFAAGAMLLLGFFTGDGARIDLPDGLAAFDWYFAIWTRLRIKIYAPLVITSMPRYLFIRH